MNLLVYLKLSYLVQMHTVVVDPSRRGNLIIVVCQCSVYSVIARSQCMCDILQFSALSFVGIIDVLSKNQISATNSELTSNLQYLGR